MSIFSSRLYVELARLESLSGGLVPGLCLAFNPELLELLEEDAVNISAHTYATAGRSPVAVQQAASSHTAASIRSILWTLVGSDSHSRNTSWTANNMSPATVGGPHSLGLVEELCAHLYGGQWLIRLLNLFAPQSGGGMQNGYRRTVTEQKRDSPYSNSENDCSTSAGHSSNCTATVCGGSDAVKQSGVVELQRRTDVRVSSVVDGCHSNPPTATRCCTGKGVGDGCRILVLFSKEYSRYWKIEESTNSSVTDSQNKQCTGDGNIYDNQATGPAVERSSLDVLLSSSSSLIGQDDGGDTQRLLLRAAVESFQYRTSICQKSNNRTTAGNQDGAEWTNNDCVEAVFLIEVYEDYPFCSPLVSCLFISVPAVYRHVRTYDAENFTRNVILRESWSPKITLESVLERVGSFVRQSLQQAALQPKDAQELNSSSRATLYNTGIEPHRHTNTSSLGSLSNSTSQGVDNKCNYPTTTVVLLTVLSAVVLFVQHIMRTRAAAAHGQTSTATDGVHKGRNAMGAAHNASPVEDMFKWLVVRSGVISSEYTGAACTVPMELCLIVVEAVLILVPSVLYLMIRLHPEPKCRVQRRTCVGLLLSAMPILLFTAQPCDASRRIPSAAAANLAVFTATFYSCGYITLALTAATFSAITVASSSFITLLLPLAVCILSLCCCERNQRGFLRIRTNIHASYLVVQKLVYIVVVFAVAAAAATVPLVLLRYASTEQSNEDTLHTLRVTVSRFLTPLTASIASPTETSPQPTAASVGLPFTVSYGKSIVITCVALLATVLAQMPSLLGCWKKPSALRLTCSILCSYLSWHFLVAILAQFAGATLQYSPVGTAGQPLYDSNTAASSDCASPMVIGLLSLLLATDIGYLSVLSVGVTWYYAWLSGGVFGDASSGGWATAVATACIALWLYSFFRLIPLLSTRHLECQRRDLDRGDRSLSSSWLQIILRSMILFVVLPTINIYMSAAQILLSEAEFITAVGCANKLVGAVTAWYSSSSSTQGLLLFNNSGHHPHEAPTWTSHRIWFDTFIKDLCTTAGTVLLTCILTARLLCDLRWGSSLWVLHKLPLGMLSVVLIASTSYAAVRILTADDIFTSPRTLKPLRTRRE